ncbi:hypothetical protein PBRA_008678 [Plasmodiophora brassicae]|nr:hypothetical protein PBRA_008678 [Plasmodiophora brassicae]
MQVVRGGVDRIAMTRVEIDAEYGLAGVADDLQRAIDETDRVLADAETRLASERHQLDLQSSTHDEQVADAKGAEMSRVAQLEELKRKVAAVTDETAAVKAQNSKDLQDISCEFQKRMQDIEHDMVSLSGGAELQLRRKLMALTKENQQLQSQIASLTSKIDHANHHPAPRRRKRPLTVTGSL